MELEKSDKIIRALRKIRPNASFSVSETYSSLTWHDGGGVEGENQNKPTEQEFNDVVLAFNTEWDSQEYARDRKAEYDALNQFEMQYDDEEDGTTTWKDAIVAIKTKWPKDNSGPVE